MKAKSKKTLCALLLVVVEIFGYYLWLLLRPVEIVAVHQDGNSSDVLVRKFGRDADLLIAYALHFGCNPWQKLMSSALSVMKPMV